jgi:hypothetical protein
MADPSVAQWIYRAAEAEGLADTMSDPEAKRLMFGIAAGYERLAEHASARKERQKDVDATLSATLSRASSPLAFRA